ncbi:MAG: hypothetical protein H7A25_18970 [Leptospiraceae bacterium]|nr:hypothetical protein [Leptospiraceae bacterium]
MGTEKNYDKNYQDQEHYKAYHEFATQTNIFVVEYNSFWKQVIGSITSFFK